MYNKNFPYRPRIRFEHGPGVGRPIPESKSRLSRARPSLLSCQSLGPGSARELAKTAPSSPEPSGLRGLAACQAPIVSAHGPPTSGDLVRRLQPKESPPVDGDGGVVVPLARPTRSSGGPVTAPASHCGQCVLFWLPTASGAGLESRRRSKRPRACEPGSCPNLPLEAGPQELGGRGSEVAGTGTGT
ncbi:unnamed protein product, partial [Protopolystoma xenopodis]